MNHFPEKFFVGRRVSPPPRQRVPGMEGGKKAWHTQDLRVVLTLPGMQTCGGRTGIIPIWTGERFPRRLLPPTDLEHYPFRWAIDFYITGGKTWRCWRNWG